MTIFSFSSRFFFSKILAIACACLLLLPTFVAMTHAADKSIAYRLGGTRTANYDVSVKDTEIAFRLLFDELLAEINEHLSIKVYQNIDELWVDFNANKLDGIYATTLEMLDRMDSIRQTPLMSFAVNGTPFVRYQLIVKRDSPFKTLQDLRGKRLAVTHHVDIAEMFLDVELLSRGLPQHDDFFSSISREGSTHSGAVDLFFGKVDAALVAATSFDVAARLNPQLKTEARVLLESAEMVPSFTCVRLDFPEQRITQLSQVATTLQNKPRGRHLLKMFGTDAIVPIDIDALASVKQLREQHRKLIGQ